MMSFITSSNNIRYKSLLAFCCGILLSLGVSADTVVSMDPVIGQTVRVELTGKKGHYASLKLRSMLMARMLPN